MPSTMASMLRTLEALSLIYGDKPTLRRTIQRVFKELKDGGDGLDQRHSWQGSRKERVRCPYLFLDSVANSINCEHVDSIITVDETWVHYCTPETKQQSKQ